MSGNNHGLDVPTTPETRAFLKRTCGDEADANWREACERAGVDPKKAELGPIDLLAVSKTLVELGGRASIIGNCMWVRLASFDGIEQQGPAEA